MHYYSFNIGDYASHTRHLSEMEDLAYRRLLDLYYLHEKPLNECSTTVSRLINMRKHEKDVQAVLEEFFTYVEGRGWTHSRADQEIAKYHEKLESASRAGKLSAEKRANARSTPVQRTFNRKATDVQLNINQETGTIKQEPEDKDIGAHAPISLVKKSKHEKFRPAKWLTDRGVPVDIAEDWLKVRIAKKLVHTERAFESVAKEAIEANMSLPDAIEYCVKKSWGGFEAKWLSNEMARNGNGNGGKLPAYQESIRSAGLAIFGNLEEQHGRQSEIIDVTPKAPAGYLGTEDL